MNIANWTVGTTTRPVSRAARASPVLWHDVSIDRTESAFGIARHHQFLAHAVALLPSHQIADFLDMHPDDVL
jgi:hypothetical protein